jgi:hypothetical protein
MQLLKSSLHRKRREHNAMIIALGMIIVFLVILPINMRHQYYVHVDSESGDKVVLECAVVRGATFCVVHEDVRVGGNVNLVDPMQTTRGNTLYRLPTEYLELIGDPMVVPM